MTQNIVPASNSSIQDNQFNENDSDHITNNSLKVQSKPNPQQLDKSSHPMQIDFKHLFSNKEHPD